MKMEKNLSPKDEKQRKEQKDNLLSTITENALKTLLAPYGRVTYSYSRKSLKIQPLANFSIDVHCDSEDPIESFYAGQIVPLELLDLIQQYRTFLDAHQFGFLIGDVYWVDWGDRIVILRQRCGGNLYMALDEESESDFSDITEFFDKFEQTVEKCRKQFKFRLISHHVSFL